jgi:hypothetical protein
MSRGRANCIALASLASFIGLSTACGSGAYATQSGTWYPLKSPALHRQSAMFFA